MYSIPASDLELTWCTLVAFVPLPPAPTTRVADWMDRYGRLVDAAAHITRAHGGRIEKLLRRGALAVFRGPDAVRAVNATIAVQEYMHRADARLGEPSSPCLRLAAAICSGHVVFPAGDSVGSAVDRVDALARLAPAGAIIIDARTDAACNWNLVESKVGAATSRDAARYRRGPIRLAGAAQYTDIPIFEAVWDIRGRIEDSDIPHAPERPADPESSLGAGAPGPRLADIAQVMAELAGHTGVERLLARAGLAADSIDLRGAARDVWFRVVHRAWGEARLPALLSVFREEYPKMVIW